MRAGPAGAGRRAPPADTEDAIVAVRKRFPTWGPTRIRRWLTARYPRPLLRLDADGFGFDQRADDRGAVLWRRHKIVVSPALAHEVVRLAPVAGGRVSVCFGPIELGWLDEARLGRGLIRPARRRGARPEIVVSTLAWA